MDSLVWAWVKVKRIFLNVISGVTVQHKYVNRVGSHIIGRRLSRGLIKGDIISVETFPVAEDV